MVVLGPGSLGEGIPPVPAALAKSHLKTEDLLAVAGPSSMPSPTISLEPFPNGVRARSQNREQAPTKRSPNSGWRAPADAACRGHSGGVALLAIDTDRTAWQFCITFLAMPNAKNGSCR
jgi:hypothetical protein